MSRLPRLFACFFLVFFGVVFLYSAENRYALIIGNGNYRDRTIPNLTNPVNDATDVASALKGMGFSVTLKTNLNLRDMITTIRDFTADLRKSPETEGFFWFAGHGLSIKGIHYLLPVDVDPSDDSIMARGSFSVDELMEEIEATLNRTNLIVIDACRNNVLPGGSRSVAGRGLAVLSRDDYRIKGNKIVYSTMAGKTASDGEDSNRNSPFAQAFLSRMNSPEIFDDVFLDIANETLRLTHGEQEPYSMGSFAVKSYTLNPQGIAASAPAAKAPEQTNTASVESTRANPDIPRSKEPSPDFVLDGKRVMSLSIAPSLNGGTFSDDGGFGVGVTFAFYEKYRSYGEMFFLPNSFFVSVEYVKNSREIDSSMLYTDAFLLEFPAGNCRQLINGAIFGVGAQWKLRLGRSQRFITNFGVSLVFFTVNSDIQYEEVSVPGLEYNTGFQPGIGVSGAFGFRISPMISLDLGVAWKMDFVGKDFAYTETDYLTYYIEYSAKAIHPYTFGGFLGLSFWWP